MLKARLFGFAVALVAVIAGASPVTALAAETDTDTVTLSEKDKEHKGNRALFEEKLNKAIQKWDALTTEQKNDVYILLEDEVKAQNKVLDRLVELGVMDKNDASKMKSERMARFGKLRKSGEFPLMKHKGDKKCK